MPFGLDIDCGDKNSVPAECMACDEEMEEEYGEAEYETCEAMHADWGASVFLYWKAADETVSLVNHIYPLYTA